MLVTPAPAWTSQQALGWDADPRQQGKTQADGPSMLGLLRGSAHNLYSCFFRPVVSRDREVLALAREKSRGKDFLTLLSILMAQVQGPSQGRRAPNINPQMGKVLALRGGSPKHRTHFGGTLCPNRTAAVVGDKWLSGQEAAGNGNSLHEV